MDLPVDVHREVEALQSEIQRLVEGRWDLNENTAGSKKLRSQARSVVLAAQKVEEAVRQNTYSAR
ncbi:MAG TPA: hypothetical protein VMY38_01570 [Gemmatimonadaceae bacterium]|nr:hypothetical protein [Gemmatimonadaceae bacterium]